MWLTGWTLEFCWRAELKIPVWLKWNFETNVTSSVRWTGTTWELRRPAVGDVSLGSDSGMTASLSTSDQGQPTHTPLLWITTGATAVTRPPAAGLRRRLPSESELTPRVNGRRLETTMRLELVMDMLTLLPVQRFNYNWENYKFDILENTCWSRNCTFSNYQVAVYKWSCI